MMGYLYMAAVLASWSAIGFVYRRAGKQHASLYVLASILGFTTFALNFVMILVTGVDVSEAYQGAFWFGIMVGIINVAYMPPFLGAVSRGDLSITWTVATLSFALASAISIVYPGESPTTLGVIGLVTAGVAIAMLGLDMFVRNKVPSQNRTEKGWGICMFLAFVLSALNLWGFTLESRLAPDESTCHKLAFLLTASGSLGVGSLVLALLLRPPGPKKPAVYLGLLAGAILFSGWYFTLLALGNASIPAYVLYPATTGGSNIFVVVISVLVLKERPGVYGWIGLGIGLLAIVILGIAA
jgi:uncharacterized membrane protein